MIDLYTAGTPNGRKVSIALEEMGIAYRVIRVNLKDLEQKRPAFLALNPNGRIPVIVDRDANDFPVFESGAILIYLAEKSGLFLPRDAVGRSVTLQWLMWQMGGLGPMQGQSNVFTRYFPEKIPVVIARYQTEVARLFGVMDTRLREVDYLAGEYSIADMACYPWVAQHDWSGVSLEPFEHLVRWFERVGARAGAVAGMAIPDPPQQPRVEEGAAMLITNPGKAEPR